MIWFYVNWGEIFVFFGPHWEFEINFLVFIVLIVRDSCKVEAYRCNENDIVAPSNLDSKKANLCSPKALHKWLATSTLSAKYGFIKGCISLCISMAAVCFATVLRAATNYRALNNPKFKLNFKVLPMLLKRIRALLMWRKPLNHTWIEASLSILFQQLSFFKPKVHCHIVRNCSC